MYTMLVVDDNPSDRNGICSLLDWGELGIEIVGTCANGAKAFAAVCEQKVDIVLTDIAMPIMNGIELAEKIREHHHATKIVFMSCFSDFEYARSAMDLDIYGYVLKPILPEELEKAVKKLLKELLDEESRTSEKEVMVRQIKEMLPMVQEQFLKELLLGSGLGRGEIEERIDYLSIGIPPHSSLAVISLAAEDFEGQTSHLSVEDKYYIMYSVKAIAAAQSIEGRKVLPVQFTSTEYSFLVFSGQDMPEGDIAASVMDTAVAIHSAILSSLRLNTVLGISRCDGDIARAGELYRQSREAVDTPFYGGINPIIRYELVEGGRHSASDLSVNLEELYRQIKDLIAAGSEEECSEFLARKYTASTGALPEPYVRSLTFSILSTSAVVLLEAGCSFKDVFGSEAAVWDKATRSKSLDGVRQFLLDVFGKINKYFAVKSGTRNAKVVDAIKQIIMARYREQLAVEDISKSVFLSQGYANALFKKETGMSIFDFLLQYRLDRAKALLMNPDCKVTVVSESVGYDNKPYFSLMFKKYVGMSPSEYKARFAR